jgi:uncharacterized protein (DUF433 family)
MGHCDRITIDPRIRGGKPYIKGSLVTVGDVLSCFASGMSFADVLDDFPDLMVEDIQACFAFAAAHEQETMLAFHTVKR